jgi:hypothetical protein
MSRWRRTSSGGPPPRYLVEVDEEGDPYPPQVHELILKVLSGASAGPEWKERLARLNEQLEHSVQVCKTGCTPINLESVLLEVCEALESLDDELS